MPMVQDLIADSYGFLPTGMSVSFIPDRRLPNVGIARVDQRSSLCFLLQVLLSLDDDFSL